MNVKSGLIEIKKATEKDTYLVSVLATVTFFEAYFEQDAPADLANYIVESFSPASIKEQLNDPNSTFFIISIDSHAVGFAKLISGSTDPSTENKKTIELKRIYIVERMWRKGVGETLLRHCEEFARELGNDSIWLGVWQLNERGQSFYAKQGFVKKGTITFPYGNSVGINDVMEKKL